MCSREVNLTEEEKEILKAEGLPIPTTLPLTKVLHSLSKSDGGIFAQLEIYIIFLTTG